MSCKRHCRENLEDVPETFNNSGSTSSTEETMADKVKKRDRLLKENFDLHMKLLTQNLKWQYAVDRESSGEDEERSTNRNCTLSNNNNVTDILAEKVKERNLLLKENFELHMKLLRAGYRKYDLPGCEENLVASLNDEGSN